MRGRIIDELHQLVIGPAGDKIKTYSIVEANGGQLYRGEKYENRGIGDMYEFCFARRSKQVSQSFNDVDQRFYYAVVDMRNRIII